MGQQLFILLSVVLNAKFLLVPIGELTLTSKSQLPDVSRSNKSRRKELLINSPSLTGSNDPGTG